MTRINLIFARASNGAIGKDNALPWHLPEDMAHFRRQTGKDAVIMGRRTWDSLPAKFRPLPGRLNIVVTRQTDWQEDGALRASDLSEAIALAEQTSAAEVWVIGGAQLFQDAIAVADRAESSPRSNKTSKAMSSCPPSKVGARPPAWLTFHHLDYLTTLSIWKNDR